MKPHISKNLLIILGLVIIALALRLIPGPRTIDDSYITFRYTKNILAGNGFTYNPTERVLGTTTPLYTLLLTVIGIFCGGAQAPFPIIAWILNAFLDAVSVVLLFYIGKSIATETVGVFIALLWSIAPYSVTFSIGGLETSLFILILLAITLATLNKKWYLAAFLSALSILIRPDALIIVVLIALYRFKSYIQKESFSSKTVNPRVFALELSAFLIPVTIWLFFALFYFGNPLPHSIVAKSVAYRLPSHTALIRLLQHYATPFLDNLTFGTNGIALGLFAYPMLSIIGSRHILKKNSDYFPFALFPWFYFLVYALANPLIFRWYLTPPLPFYFLTIIIGIQQVIITITNNIFARYAKPSHLYDLRLASFFVICAWSFLILMTLRGWTIKPDHGLSRPAPTMAWYQLELHYKEAADFLADRIGTSSKIPLVAAGDVGVLGYYTDAEILDTVGLNSKQALDYYPLDQKYYVINYAIPPDLIFDYQPDYIVILEVYGRNGLLIDPRFNIDYKLIKQIPTDIYGSNNMRIYQRIEH